MLVSYPLHTTCSVHSVSAMPSCTVSYCRLTALHYSLIFLCSLLSALCSLSGTYCALKWPDFTTPT